MFLSAFALLVLDAYFSTASAFCLARSVYSTALKQLCLNSVERAKKNDVAYF